MARPLSVSRKGVGYQPVIAGEVLNVIGSCTHRGQ